MVDARIFESWFQFPINQPVYIYNMKTKRWDVPATVVSRTVHNKAVGTYEKWYVVVTERGAEQQLETSLKPRPRRVTALPS